MNRAWQHTNLCAKIFGMPVSQPNTWPPDYPSTRPFHRYYTTSLNLRATAIADDAPIGSITTKAHNARPARGHLKKYKYKLYTSNQETERSRRRAAFLILHPPVAPKVKVNITCDPLLLCTILMLLLLYIPPPRAGVGTKLRREKRVLRERLRRKRAQPAFDNQHLAHKVYRFWRHARSKT